MTKKQVASAATSLRLLKTVSSFVLSLYSRIKNYSKKTKEGDPIKADNLIYGEQTYERSPYFLGKILPGQVLQVMDNNMYQAPTYPHSLPPTDFILSRTAESYYIRMTEDIFVVGQQFPKIVVPGPNSKRANQHTRNFLQVNQPISECYCSFFLL